MRAALIDAYGGPEVVRLGEVEDPTVGPNDVLVRVGSVAVTAGDARIRGARFPAGFGPLARLALGLTRPRQPILGSAHCGRVEAVGGAVEGVAVGDRVATMTGTKMRAHAEIVKVPAKRVVAVPDAVSEDEAAGLLFGGTTALRFVDRTRVEEGSRVLVTGASGAVGSAAVQLARQRGAQVTAVTSADHMSLVADLGAVEVIDRAVTDIGQLTERYDSIIDAAGSLSISSGRRLLAPGGRLGLVVASLGETIRARGSVVAGAAPESPEAMSALLALVASGQLKVVLDPNHDPSLGLGGVAEAHRRIDSGAKAGALVVRPGADA